MASVPAGLSFITPVSHGEDRRPSETPSKDTSGSATSQVNATRASDAQESQPPTEPQTPFEPRSRDELLHPPEHARLSLHDIETRISRRSASQQRRTTEHFEEGSPTEALNNSAAYQGVPPELKNLLAEVIFVLICSTGQMLFGFLLGNVTVCQFEFVKALDIKYSQTPWLVGAFLFPMGLSVILSGSASDLSGPKTLMVGAFAWLTIWNTVGAFSISPELKILFFFVRAMSGLAVGVLVSACMSVLGRIYKPGLRKTRVFSSMAAMAPTGFYVGNLQGGALQSHLPWIFGSNAILCGICCVLGFLTVPSLKPVKDTQEEDAPSMKQFDFLGALCASLGTGCILFGLTQGSATQWSPYTYSLVVIGVAFLVAFFFVERRATRPIIPNRLWTTPGFLPLIIAYFLGFGAYVGGWQFYAVQFWLRYKGASPLTVALYNTPNAIVGLLATFIVSKTLHLIDTHWILTASMIGFALGPVFFLPQTPNTSYWALSMPGVALVTFGPDLSFAAASIFITSSVPRSYQGSAGSLLVTVQNLSAAIITSVADSIGNKVDANEQGEIGLKGMKAIWWFAFALSMAGAVICATMVRIKKSEEKEHSS